VSTITGSRAHLRFGTESRLLPAILLTFIFAANFSLCISIRHIFSNRRYESADYLRQLLIAALILNVLSTIFASFYRWRVQWRRRFVPSLAGLVVLSLLAFVLVRIIKTPQHDLRLHAFGAAYAIFVYLHLTLLITYALGNGERTSTDKMSGKSLEAWVFLVSLIIYGAITPWVKYACWPTADEPHYLLLTHSLVFDHDFDLANNYKHNDYKVFYPPNITNAAHHSVPNIRGQEVPVHDVGLSVLLVPGYALRGRFGAMLELNLFGALLALGIFELGLSFSGSRSAALASWTLFAFTSPIVVYTSQIYPEIIGAGVGVWAMFAHTKFTNTQNWRFLLLAGSLLAGLPWLSVRYWLILGPMLAVMALHLLVTKRANGFSLAGHLALIALPAALSLFAFAAFDVYWYQTAIPNAGYVLLLRPRPSLFSHDLLPGLPGLLFDRAFGLLPTAPVYVLAIAGAALLCRRSPWQGLLLTSPAVAYVLFAAPNKFWYGGWAPPPRYIVTGVALLAPAAAVILASRIPRWLLGLLTAWSFFIAIAYMALPLARYTHWTSTESALGDFLANVLGFHFDDLFPSFIRARVSDYLLFVLWLCALVIGLLVLTRHTSRIGRSNAGP
jgi:hypothetical protein